MAKTIYTYLHNDDLNGSRIVYMDNCFCKLFKIQRTDGDFLQIFKEDLQKPALYILLNREEWKAYIGETDAFFTRIQQHISRKKFWAEALAFTASDDSLSKTEVQYLEYLAYDKANRMNVFDDEAIANCAPQETSLSQYDIEKLIVTVRIDIC